MEDRRQMFLNKIGDIMKNDYPLFKNMELYGFYDQLSEKELIYVLSGIFGEPVRYSDDIIYDDNGIIFNENGNQIYLENSNGDWEKWEYDEDGRILYREYDTGKWKKWEYDENGKQIYYEDSDGLIRHYR